MAFDVVNTEQAPAAIGPYSQAVKAGSMLYVSGQIPLDPESGEVNGSDFTTQAKQVLDNLKAVVEAAGSSMSQVVKVTVYITDMGQFGAVNEIYGEYFSAPFPARACVEVSRLPKDVNVEMDAIVQLS